MYDAQSVSEAYALALLALGEQTGKIAPTH
jgi:hypothetical protein